MAENTLDQEIVVGSCFCKKVQYKAWGDQMFNVYCHCTICQRLTGAPFTHFIAFHEDNLQITQGQDSLEPVKSSENCLRYRCKHCGSPVYSQSLMPQFKFRDVCSSTITSPDLHAMMNQEKWKAKSHIFYKNRQMDVKDGLPKFEGYANFSEQMSE